MKEHGSKTKRERVGIAELKSPHSLNLQSEFPEFVCLILQSQWCHIPDFMPLLLIPFSACASLRVMVVFLLWDNSVSLQTTYFTLWKYWAATCNPTQDSPPILWRKVKSCGYHMQRASLEKNKGFNCSVVQISAPFVQMYGHLNFIYTEISHLCMGKKP